MKKPTRRQKRLAADRFKTVIKLGNGRKRALDDLQDAYRTILNQIMRGR